MLKSSLEIRDVGLHLATEDLPQNEVGDKNELHSCRIISISTIRHTFIGMEVPLDEKRIQSKREYDMATTCVPQGSVPAPRKGAPGDPEWSRWS